MGLNWIEVNVQAAYFNSALATLKKKLDNVEPLERSEMSQGFPWKTASLLISQ